MQKVYNILEENGVSTSRELIIVTPEDVHFMRIDYILKRIASISKKVLRNFEQNIARLSGQPKKILSYLERIGKRLLSVKL